LAVKSGYAAFSRLEENPPETISELRTSEANCAATFFRSWGGMPIKWRGTSRRPSRWLAVRWSAFLALPSGWQPQRGDPVNAIVNYAYAALESEIRIKAICDGYDPTIGRPREKSPGRDARWREEWVSREFGVGKRGQSTGNLTH
jgi:CRISPR-associated protein Cas1